MTDAIIIAILMIVCYVGLKETVKHFKGQGACCGGSFDVKPKRKKLNGPVVCKHILRIEGMHCESCRNRIERKINELDGVACRVNLRKKEAVVTATHEIDQFYISDMIDRLGYEVKSVRRDQ